MGGAFHLLMYEFPVSTIFIVIIVPFPESSVVSDSIASAVCGLVCGAVVWLACGAGRCVSSPGAWTGVLLAVVI